MISWWGSVGTGIQEINRFFFLKNIISVKDQFLWKIVGQLDAFETEIEFFRFQKFQKWETLYYHQLYFLITSDQKNSKQKKNKKVH